MPASYVLRLTVTDDDGATAYAEITITVRAPVLATPGAAAIGDLGGSLSASPVDALVVVDLGAAAIGDLGGSLSASPVDALVVVDLGAAAIGDLGGSLSVVVPIFPEAPAAPTVYRIGPVSVRVSWRAPDSVTDIIGYEYQHSGGGWFATGSNSPGVDVHNLSQNTAYMISIRAIGQFGPGAASPAASFQTGIVSPPSNPRFPRCDVTGVTAIDLFWLPPLEDFDSPVTHYQIQVIDEDGSVQPWEDTDDAALTWRVRGLAIGHRYGFRVRAVSASGESLASSVIYDTPLRSRVEQRPQGQRIPLLDVDRQSLILRIAGQDCRLHVWWHPDEEDGYGRVGAWWGGLEVPVNTPAVRSRRLALNSGILDRVDDVLPGNIVLRELAATGEEPGRDAFRRPTHALMWEPDQ